MHNLRFIPAASSYPRTAVRVTVPNLTIEGVGNSLVSLQGAGFEYSGVGRTPRAIIQLDPGASGAVIRNLDLVGAHNNSHNGAGVRINGARNVTVERCDIHGNDMGVMSNGSTGEDAHGANQLFQDCHIHHNGDPGEPGQNHNLYLAGNSVTLRHCEVDHSLTGHNVKSRSHFTLVEDCYVHDSANGEFDFVDSAETEKPNSNAAIVNSVIDKDPQCAGNRVTIHFGHERGVRNGKIYILHCTLLTPFMSAVLSLDGPSVSAELDRNIVVNAEQSAPKLVEASDGAKLDSVIGGWNWLSRGYSLTGTKLDPKTRYAGSSRGDTLGISAPSFLPARTPDVGTPDPTYYLDGSGKQWEVTPRAALGARWRRLRLG